MNYCFLLYFINNFVVCGIIIKMIIINKPNIFFPLTVYCWQCFPHSLHLCPFHSFLASRSDQNSRCHGCLCCSRRLLVSNLSTSTYSSSACCSACRSPWSICRATSDVASIWTSTSSQIATCRGPGTSSPSPPSPAPVPSPFLPSLAAKGMSCNKLWYFTFIVLRNIPWVYNSLVKFLLSDFPQ